MSATPYTPPALTKPWWDVATPGNTTLPTGMGATTAATPKLGATAQDTGANQGGTFGQLPPGFNAWQNYNDPASNSSWNYTQDPNFNAAADRPVWDLAQTGNNSETDRARVWRFAQDALKNGQTSDGQRYASPGSAPTAVVNAAYLAAIQRLKRDYQAPENAAKGMNWANSAYAGYDQYLPGGQGGTGAQAGSGLAPGWFGPLSPQSLPNGGMMYDQPGQPGKNIFSPPPGGQTTPATGPGNQQGGSTVDPNAGSAGAAAAAAAAAGLGAPTSTTPPGGTSAAPMGGYYASDPSAAVTQFLAQHNVQIGDHNPWAEFLRKLATGIASPIVSTLPTGANGQQPLDRLNSLPDMLSKLIYGNGGQAFGNIANYGNQVQSEWTPDKLGSMQVPEVEKLLASIRGFQTLGQNPYQQDFNQQAMADLFERYKSAVTGAAQAGGQAPNAQWLVNPANDPFHIFSR